MAVAATSTGLLRPFITSPNFRPLDGLFIIEPRLIESASAAAACAARRAAAMKSDLPASAWAGATSGPRSSRTRRMMAFKSGAPEPGSSGSFAISGSTGVSSETSGAASCSSGSGSAGCWSRSLRPVKARVSPPNIEVLAACAFSLGLLDSSAASAASAAASAGLRFFCRSGVA